MATATLERPANHAVTATAPRTCECISCGVAIANENVRIEIHAPPNAAQTTRVTQVYCEFCDVIYEETANLIAGQWHLSGNTTVVRDRRKREAFLRRLAGLKGDVLR